MKKLFTITVKHRRWKPGADGHQGEFEYLPDARHEVELNIDEGRLVQSMGEQAIKNKSGKCVDGFVTVRHIRQL